LRFYSDSFLSIFVNGLTKSIGIGIGAMMVALQNKEELDRSLVMPVGTLAAMDNELPAVVTGSRYLRTKSDLTGWELTELNSTGTAAASDATPQVVELSAGDAGTSDDYSRADHSHLEDDDILNAVNIHNALNFI